MIQSPPLPREEFSVTENLAYFNHAAVGILPRRSVTALTEFLTQHAEHGVLGTWRYEAQLPKYREAIARFIGATASEIALLRNTGDGANAIAQGLDWRKGDEILINDHEFPANAYPWLATRAAGVNVRFVRNPGERMTPDVLRRHMSPRTRLVSISWVMFDDGYRHDLAALAEVAHAGGAMFCVDAIQGLGALQFDVARFGVDAAYAGGAKWLMSLQGVSFLYVRAGLIDRLRLAAPGWRSARDIWNFLDYDQGYAPDATRFEGGTANILGALSLDRAIDLLASVAPDELEGHVLSLTDRLCEKLERIGATIHSDRGPCVSSAIVLFSIPNRDSVALGRELQRRGFVTTYRENGVRVAPHGYNTAEEIDAFAVAVEEAAGTLVSK